MDRARRARPPGPCTPTPPAAPCCAFLALAAALDRRLPSSPSPGSPLQVFIDATDGWLARLARVSASACPQFSGAHLDDIVDYLTYVFVPAAHGVARAARARRRSRVARAGRDAAVERLRLLAHSTRRPTDHFFTGFPSYWNIVVFYLVALADRARWSNAACAASLLAVLVFVPIRYLYPSRTVPFMRTHDRARACTWAAADASLTLRRGCPTCPRGCCWHGLRLPRLLRRRCRSWLHVRAPTRAPEMPVRHGRTSRRGVRWVVGASGCVALRARRRPPCGGAIGAWWVAKHALAIRRLHTQGVGDTVLHVGRRHAPWFRMDEQRSDVPLARDLAAAAAGGHRVEDHRFYQPSRASTRSALARAVWMNVRTDEPPGRQHHHAAARAHAVPVEPAHAGAQGQGGRARRCCSSSSCRRTRSSSCT